MRFLTKAVEVVAFGDPRIANDREAFGGLVRLFQDHSDF